MRGFRAQVIEAVRRKYPQFQARAGEEDSFIEIGTSTVDLMNIHATVRLLPARRRQAAIDDFVDRMAEAVNRLENTNEASWAEMSKLLRPRLISPGMQPAGADLLLMPFATTALNAYVIDRGGSVDYVDRDLLASWGVDGKQVHDTAVANLEALSERVKIERHEVRGGGRYAAIATGDSYDAARLVLPRFRARLLAALGTPIFVGIPNRDFLAAWSFELFAVFADRMVKDFGEQPYPITDTVFRFDRDGVRSATAEDRRRR